MKGVYQVVRRFRLFHSLHGDKQLVFPVLINILVSDTINERQPFQQFLVDLVIFFQTVSFRLGFAPYPFPDCPLYYLMDGSDDIYKGMLFAFDNGRVDGLQADCLFIVFSDAFQCRKQKSSFSGSTIGKYGDGVVGYFLVLYVLAWCIVAGFLIQLLKYFKNLIHLYLMNQILVITHYRIRKICLRKFQLNRIIFCFHEV